jgi:hypothetical protein
MDKQRRTDDEGQKLKANSRNTQHATRKYKEHKDVTTQQEPETHEHRYRINEVHNFGGFFGGDTVTLTATPYDAPEEERELTIDERALTNVRDRYTVAAGMLFALEFAGDRVDRATLLGAATHAELRAALGPAQFDAPLTAPQILSYRCDSCGLWVAGAPEEGKCVVCGHAM